MTRKKRERRNKTTIIIIAQKGIHKEVGYREGKKEK